MEALFLDFDGVVVNSLEETYRVSRDAYYGFSRKFPEQSMRELFVIHRGLAGPLDQFLSLHRALESVVDGAQNVEEEFAKFESVLGKAERDAFVSRFLDVRKAYQEELMTWLQLNPLSNYGETLKGRKLEHTYIVTTKNRRSVELLLEHHDIRVCGLMTKEDFDTAGDKGKLVSAFLDDHSDYHRGVFVDDHAGHLDAVSRDSRVKCYFADWGFGKNRGYEVYQFRT